MLRTPIPSTPLHPRKRPTDAPRRHHPYPQEEVSPCTGRERQRMGNPSPSAHMLMADICVKQEERDEHLRPMEGQVDISLNILDTVTAQRPSARARAPTGTGRSGFAQTRAMTRPAREAAKLNAEIAALKGHIRALQRSEKRLKDQVAFKVELLKDARGERDEARTECIKAEEALEEKENMLEGATREANRYRGWWLTDYYSLKVALGLVPNKKDVEAIALGSKDRFLAYSAALKQQK